MALERPAKTSLRPYQEEALAAVADFVDNGGRCGLIVMPTGGGKTICFSRLAERLGLTSREKMLILVHRDELVTQAVDKYRRDNPGDLVGVEKANRRATSMDRVCVASVQTLQGARLDEFTQRWGVPSLIVTDEAHHATAPTYASVYEHFEATFTGDVVHIGVTATPRRGDGAGLDKVFQKVVHSTTIDELIAQGWLVDLRGYRVRTQTSLEGLTKRDMDSDRKVANLIDTQERNAQVVKAYQDLAEGRRTIVFCATREHSENLAAHFSAVGVKATWVAGDGANGMTLSERRQRLADFAGGAYDVVCNAQVLTEGYDEPTVSCVIIARPMTKQGLYAQCVGRGTRILDHLNGTFAAIQDIAQAETRRALIAKSGKADCIVIDVMDVSKRHALASLPSLLGLPPNFDLKGRSATKAARDFEDMVGESAAVAAMVLDAEMLEQIEAVPKEKRMRALIDAVRAVTQEYVSVDLLSPKPLPEYAQGAATMTWFTEAQDRFRLNLAKESVIVEKNLLGTYDAFWQTKHRSKPLPGSPFDTILKAISTCEHWIRKARGEQTVLIDANAAWRAKPASQKQRGVLYYAGVKVPKGLTAGEAAKLIDTLHGKGA
jgi:superfamily II DNA or RNA helicase